MSMKYAVAARLLESPLLVLKITSIHYLYSIQYLYTSRCARLLESPVRVLQLSEQPVALLRQVDGERLMLDTPHELAVEAVDLVELLRRIGDLQVGEGRILMLVLIIVSISPPDLKDCIGGAEEVIAVAPGRTLHEGVPYTVAPGRALHCVRLRGYVWRVEL